MNRAVAALASFLVCCATPCFAETIEASLRISDQNTKNKEKILTAENLKKIKQKILAGGKTSEYCQTYNNNPADESKSYCFYLNPDDAWNLNCDRKNSNFNLLVIRKKDMGKNQYMQINFKDPHLITLSVNGPSDDLTVGGIKSFGEDAIKEYLDIK